MQKVTLVLAAFVAGCGSGSATVSTSSTPPNGSSGGSMETPMPGGAPMPGGGGGGGAGGVAGGGGGGSGGGGSGGSGGGGGTQICTLTGPTLLATAHAVRKILADETGVYYLDMRSSAAGVYRVAPAGGPPVLMSAVIPAENGGANYDFALDDRAVYVLSLGVDVIDKSTLARRHVDITPHECASSSFTNVAAFAGTAWLAQTNEPRSGCSDAVSTTIEELAPGATQTTTLVTDAGAVVTALLADTTNVFWSNGRGIFRHAHDAGAATEQLAPAVASDLTNFATDGNTLFAANGYHYELDAVTAPNQYSMILMADMLGITVDDAHVYVGTLAGGVLRIDKDGTNETRIASGQAVYPAVDAVNVYYASGGNSAPETTVMAACK